MLFFFPCQIPPLLFSSTYPAQLAAHCFSSEVFIAGWGIKLSINQISSAVIIGTLPLLLWHTLPPLWVCPALLVLTLAGSYVAPKPAVCWLGVMLLALVWSLIHAHLSLKQVDRLYQHQVNVQGRVTSLALSDEPEERYAITLYQVEGQGLFPPVTAWVEWPPQGTVRCAGQTWQLQMALRPVHSQLNEGGFDRQRWAMARHQLLEGRVITATPLDLSCGWRQRVIQYAQRILPATHHQGILLALAFGESRFLDRETKLLLQQTGVAHLMAISGLHIGMAALFGWVLARGLQILLPGRYIGHRFPLLLSGAVALLYIMLSGVNPPAVRSGIALGLWLLLRLCAIRCSGWQVGLWTMALILAVNPLMVLSDSFWLSCFAVGALLFWFHWCPLPVRYATGWRWLGLRWLHLQLCMFMLLVPLQIAIFHGLSLASLPANLWAVPLLSFLVVPLILLALCLLWLPAIAGTLWQGADGVLGWALAPLTWLQSGWIEWDQRALYWSGVGWLAVVVWRLGIVKQAVPVMVLTGVIIVHLNAPPVAQWRVDMLDIGHGLAVLIEKEGRGVLYDTGNRWPGGSSAEQTILPFLRWRHVTLEEIIISHAHLDHQGGLAALQKAFPHATLRSSQRGLPGLPCQQGEQWQWRGLHFQALWPKRLAEQAGNNDSCVVKVSDGTHHLLLTGDIEWEAEQQLLREQRPALTATILQAPHHGSNTSSIAPFLRAVQPQIAIASASRYNVWRLPSIRVRRRYQAAGIPWRDTSRSGQLSVLFSSDSWELQGFREQIVPRWYHQRFGVQKDNE